MFKRLIRIPAKLLDYILQKRFKYRLIWKHQFKVDIGIRPSRSLAEKLKYNRLGYTNEDYFLYQLKDNDYHNYISSWERQKLENINGRFADILGEKLLFERLFGAFIGVPHIHCWVNDGKCLDMDKGNEADILSLLEQNKLLIAKPTRSVGGGKGVHRLSFENGAYFIDSQETSADRLRQTVASWENYILVDYVRQADYAKAIYPHSVNSMRITTVKRKSGEFEIVMNFHRFGTEQSKPVDNCSSGGLFAHIDLATGKLSAAVRETEPGKFFKTHPDTNAPIEGVTVPHWEDVKRKLLHVHRCFPFYTFLAWDIVIDEAGEILVLEINRGSDLMFQMITPLRHAPLGEFMREYGLLDKI